MRVTVRASSWASLFDCAARWASVTFDKKIPLSSPAALLGTAVHAGSAVYDQATTEGKPIRIDDAAGVVVDALKNPKEEVDWRNEQVLTPRTAERIALSLYSKYCAEISPRFKFVAVEKTCEELEIDMGDGLIIVLTGSLDRMYETESQQGLIQTGIIDLKSGGCRVNAEGIVSAKSDGAQLGQYEILAARETGKLIDAPAVIAGMNTKGAGNVGTVELHDCRSILVGTKERMGLLDHAAIMFRAGSFPPNPRSSICSPRYCNNTSCHYWGK